MQLKPLCYISILFPCLYFVVNAMCTLKKGLCLDLFVIVVKLCTCSTCHGTFISLDINIIFNTKVKLMLVQNYGWPTGPAKLWLWLARRPFGWPRASGKHDPCSRGGKSRRSPPTLENLFLLYRRPFCYFFTMQGPFCYFCLYVGDFFVPVGSLFGLPPLFCWRPLGDYCPLAPSPYSCLQPIVFL